MDVKEVYRKLYPLTITMDRYTGVYSGGIFTAWNLDPDEVPWEIAGGDDTAMTIFEEINSGIRNFEEINSGIRNLTYGIGRTPDEAAIDLYLKIKQ